MNFLLLLLISLVYGSVPNIALSDRDSFPFKNEQSKFTLVEFYSPMCHHCHKYTPTITKLHANLQSIPYPLAMEQFSCKGGTWCQKLDVKGLPSLRLYKGSEQVGVDLVGKHKISTILCWIDSTLKDQRIENPAQEAAPVSNAGIADVDIPVPGIQGKSEMPAADSIPTAGVPGDVL